MTQPAQVIAQLADRARERMHPGAYAYYAAGSGEQVTRDEAAAAWSRYRLRPRVLTDVSTVDVTTEVLGTALSTPLMVGPTALHRLAHPDGEVATARGARAAGALMAVSTSCSVPIEDVAAELGGPWWFQVYTRRDPAIHRGLAQRARDAGATALVLTGDLPVFARKPGVDLSTVPGVQDMYAVNTARHLRPDSPPDAGEQSADTTVETIGELASLTGLPVLVKGVLRGDEAQRCVRAGAAGIVVSTHGGRQLDRAVSSAQALPEVVAAVDGQVPVLVDGGIRCGLDVLVALALGARAVLLGRPVLWGLADRGADGVRDVLRMLTGDLAHVMALAGLDGIARIGPDLVVPAPA